ERRPAHAIRARTRNQNERESPSCRRGPDRIPALKLSMLSIRPLAISGNCRPPKRIKITARIMIHSHPRSPKSCEARVNIGTTDGIVVGVIIPPCLKLFTTDCLRLAAGDWGQIHNLSVECDVYLFSVASRQLVRTSQMLRMTMSQLRESAANTLSCKTGAYSNCSGLIRTLRNTVISGASQ